jgi:hypothetical protein
MANLYFDILIEKCKNFDDIDVKPIILVDHFVRHGKTVILSYWMFFLRENSIFNAIFSIFQKDAILGFFYGGGDVNIYLYIYIYLHTIVYHFVWEVKTHLLCYVRPFLHQNWPCYGFFSIFFRNSKMHLLYIEGD